MGAKLARPELKTNGTQWLPMRKPLNTVPQEDIIHR